MSNETVKDLHKQQFEESQLYRDEDYFTQLRLKYTAYSRGIFDCWTIATQTKKRLGIKNECI